MLILMEDHLRYRVLGTTLDDAMRRGVRQGRPLHGAGLSRWTGDRPSRRTATRKPSTFRGRCCTTVGTSRSAG
ncbi:MAG: hypothetical protein R2695_14780 [Acidimicrobiales bacterium]